MPNPDTQQHLQKYGWRKTAKNNWNRDENIGVLVTTWDKETTYKWCKPIAEGQAPKGTCPHGLEMKNQGHVRQCPECWKMIEIIYQNKQTAVYEGGESEPGEDEDIPALMADESDDEEDIDIKVYRIDKTAVLPAYQSKGAAGIDLALLKSATLLPGEAIMMDTGLAFALPKGKAGIIKAHSSLAKAGLTIDGGVIDSDYRGQVILLVRNQNKYQELTITGQNRIAQILIIDSPQYNIWEVHKLQDTD